MKAKSLSIFLLTIAVFLLSSCSPNDKKKYSGGEETALGDVVSLEVERGWEVHVMSGTSNSIRTTLPPDLKDKAIITERDGSLFLSMEGGVSFKNISSRPKAYVTLTRLKAVDCSQGVYLVFDGLFETSDDFTIEGSEGCAIKCNLITPRCTIDLSEGAVLSMKGSTDMLSLEAGEGCVIKASQFVARDANVVVSEAVLASINVTGDLKVHAEDASSVKCSGSPQNVDRHNDESSRITVR